MTVCCELEWFVLPVGMSRRKHHVLWPFFHCAKTFCLYSEMCHKECNVQAPSMHCDSKIGGIPFIYGKLWSLWSWLWYLLYYLTEVLHCRANYLDWCSHISCICNFDILGSVVVWNSAEIRAWECLFKKFIRPVCKLLYFPRLMVTKWMDEFICWLMYVVQV